MTSAAVLAVAEGVKISGRLKFKLKRTAIAASGNRSGGGDAHSLGL